MSKPGENVQQREQEIRQLREQNELLTSLVRDAPVAIVSLDLDRNVRIWNRAAEKIFGWREEEVLGRPLPHIPAGKQEEHRALHQKVVGGEAIRDVELYRLTKDGTPLRTSVSTWPLRDFGNNIVGLMAVYEDVAELEGAHAAPEIPFRGIVEQSLVGLYIIQDDIFQYANPRFAEMFGYTQDEFMGQPVEPFIFPPDRTLVLENLRRRISGELSSLFYSVRGKHKDGRVVDIEVHGTRFQYRGRPAVIGVAVDVTEEKKFESELRESEARLKAMTSQVPGVVYQLMQKPDGDLQFVYVSQGMQALCGVDAQAVMSDARRYFVLIDAQDRDGFFVSMRESAQALTPWNWQGRIHAQDGELRWIDSRASPRRLADGATIWDGLLLNISEAKRTEEEIRQSQLRFQELSRHLISLREEARSHVAREVHDVLGGTLTALKMDLRWLSRHVTEPVLVQRSQTMIDLAQEAIETVRRISSDLRPGVLDNLGLIAAIEWEAQRFSQRLDIPCEVIVERPELAFDDERATAVFRIVQEALTNISRHAQAHRVQIRVSGAPDTLVVEILDDGAGITPERINSVKSYGILGMCERARQIGGNVRIEARDGPGTRVVLSCPIQTATS